MINQLRVRPDITLAVDGQGVIRDAASAETLASEALESWQGVPWKDILTHELCDRVPGGGAGDTDESQSSCFTVKQRFPSGREFLIEYTTVKLGKKAGFIAIGRSLQAISELQSRLALVKQEQERDYWKLREIETRYRGLLEASAEAVALVRVGNMRVVEANVAATKSLGLVPGGEFHLDLPDRDRKAFDAVLEAVRLTGRAPSIALHLIGDAHWSLRGSIISSEAGAYYLFQMSPLAETKDSLPLREANRASERFSIESFVKRMPDGFAVIDYQGELKIANHTFLDLVQVGVESAVLGQNIKRWLPQPGAGISVVLDLVERHGSVHALRATLAGELGGSTEVEISAASDQVNKAGLIGLVLRDVTLRASSVETAPRMLAVSKEASDAPLGNVIKSSIETIERTRIADALAQTGGNRTLAAKRLRLSRQSLHTKLRKYRLGNN